MRGFVEAVHRSPSHTLTKAGQQSIRLLAGLGVEGGIKVPRNKPFEHLRLIAGGETVLHDG